MIETIVRGKRTTVRCLPEQTLDLKEGDWVSFAGVEGCDPLNGSHYNIIESRTSNTEFDINLDNVDLSGFSQLFQPSSPLSTLQTGYIEGTGSIRKRKNCFEVSHKSIIESYVNPTFLHCDQCRFDAHIQIHLGWRAINLFFDKNGRYPEPWNEGLFSKFLREISTFSFLFLISYRGSKYGLASSKKYQRIL